MKQPDLFDILISRYIEFTRILIDADKNLSHPLVINVFQRSEFDMRTIVPNCQYKAIEITKIQSLRKMVHTNVRLLKHAIVQAGSKQVAFVQECNGIVMDVFRTMELKIKIVCVKYFIKFFTAAEQFSHAQQAILCNILKGALELESKIDVLKLHNVANDDDVKEFVETICVLLECNGFTKRFSHEMLTQVGHICVDILRYHFANGTATPAYDPVVRPIVKILNSSPVSVELWRLFLSTDSSRYFPMDLTSVSFAVNQEPNEIKAPFWEISAMKLNLVCSKESESREDASKELNLVKLILNNARNFEHRCQIHQQIQWVKETKTNDFNAIVDKLKDVSFRGSNPNKPRQLFPNMEALASCLMKKLLDLIDPKTVPTTIADLLLVTEISVEILTLSDSQDMDDYTQLQFLLLAFCPLIKWCDLLNEHVKQEFPDVSVIVHSILEAASSGDTVIEKTLTAISNLNIQFLSSKSRDLLIDFMHQIIKSVKDPAGHKQITNILINCLMQDSYTSEQMENYLTHLMSDESCNIAVPEGLKSFLCLSHGPCIAFYVCRNGKYVNELCCKMCEYNNQMEKDTLLTGFKQNFGKLVIPPKISRRSQSNSDVNYFKLFQMSNPAVRANMTNCIPALLNHMPAMAFQAENVRIWLSPMLDDHSEIRLDMARNMKIIPELLQVSYKKLRNGQRTTCTNSYDFTFPIELLVV